MRKRSEIEAEAKQLERRLSSLVAELEELDSLPAEPTEADAIVSFRVQYREGEKIYCYTARKAISAWWLTGREKGGLTWEELLEFMSQHWRIAEEGAPISFRKTTASAGVSVVQGTKL